MELIDRWKAMNWQASEFSYTKPDLLAELKNESTSDITKLLNAYKRQYALMLVLTVITPLLALLKADDPEYIISVGLIWSYCLILSGFQTVKFVRFKLPDLSLNPTDAIRASLRLVKSINSFQANFVALFAPFVFLASLLATLTYGGKSIRTIVTNPLSMAIILVSTALLIYAGRTIKWFMTSRQCVALITKLEEHLQALE